MLINLYSVAILQIDFLKFYFLLRHWVLLHLHLFLVLLITGCNYYAFVLAKGESVFQSKSRNLFDSSFEHGWIEMIHEVIMAVKHTNVCRVGHQ